MNERSKMRLGGGARLKVKLESRRHHCTSRRVFLQGTSNERRGVNMDSVLGPGVQHLKFLLTNLIARLHVGARDK